MSHDTFTCRLAQNAAELRAYYALRAEIFCQEQSLFATSDRDECDRDAFAIVCVAQSGRVVGVVRIWETEPGQWWGGRLGVDREFRTVGTIGKSLIHTAVGTARAWGASTFFATVQQPNVVFFRRLHWQTLRQMDLLGQPHHLMEANLERYRPLDDVSRAQAASWQHRGVHDEAA